ncbi:MAG: tRNA lysidine(34) synthetase TilS [Phycisphaeraceae bacterium]|nr:tRNA lysidine(34) synthetase TilS [Phycisphaeraceae bacterium]
MSGPATIIGPHHPFVKDFSAALAKVGVRRGDRVIAAVSGGSDSVALLLALHALVPQKRWLIDLHVGHVHHHLRPEAEDEQQLVQDLCAGLAVPCHIADVYPGEADQNLEAAARSLRYEQLGKLAQRLQADFVATAHHADDQLETMLMRLIRGTSIRGLGSMRPSRPMVTGPARLIRPLLGTDRQAMANLLQEVGQRHVHDASNDQTDRWRAAIRHRVLPALKELRSDAAVKAAEAARRLQEAQDLLESLVDRHRHLIRPRDNGFDAPRRPLRELHPVLRGELIRSACLETGAGADSLPGRLLDTIVEAIGREEPTVRRFDLSGCVLLEIGPETVVWSVVKRS